MRRLMLCCALTALVLFTTVRPASAQIMEPPAQTQIMEPEAVNSQVMDPSTQTQIMEPEVVSSQVMDPSTKTQIMDTDNGGAEWAWPWLALSLAQLLLSPGGLLVLGALGRMFG